MCSFLERTRPPLAPGLSLFTIYGLLSDPDCLAYMVLLFRKNHFKGFLVILRAEPMGYNAFMIYLAALYQLHGYLEFRLISGHAVAAGSQHRQLPVEYG